MHDDLKVSEVAQFFRVSEAAVLTWIKRGSLIAYSVARSESARPIYRITRTAIEDFRTSRQITRPANLQSKRRNKRTESMEAHPYF